MPSTTIPFDDPETSIVHSFDIIYTVERADPSSGIPRPHISTLAVSCDTLPGRAAQFLSNHWDYFHDRILREEGLE